MLKQENPDFSYTENMINGFKSYETFKEPSMSGSVTTYISLSPNKSLAITMAPAINKNEADMTNYYLNLDITNTSSSYYEEYLQIVNSVKVMK